MMKQQYSLTQTQKEVLSEWDKTKRAIIEIPTGTGKTIIALDILKRKEYKNILVVCNTTNLIDQWNEELEKENLNKGKNIIVETIQTAHKYKDMDFDLLVVDESHHIFSEKWISLLDFNKFTNIVMLTATNRRDDNRHLLAKKYNLSIISNLDYEDGIREKLVSRYEIINQSIELEFEEREKLNRLNSFISENFSVFNNNFYLVRQLSFKNHRAQELMSCFQKRKQILNNAYNKRFKILEILKDETYTKCIIYNEFINQAEEISDFLTENNIVNKVYHSKTKKKEVVIKDYKDNKFKVLIAVKSLDEGFNVPDIDLAIIAASTSQKRQTIQRVCRVLRYKPDKIAKIYNLFCENSQEQVWLKRRISEL